MRPYNTALRYIAGYLFVAVVLCSHAAAVEIATGKMLGSPYDSRAFYMRSSGGEWQKTYSGNEFNPAAAGKMMNLRMAQGIYDDEWLTETSFDPNKNTARLISALDTYKDHGILAISISLQGGNAALERTGIIHRSNSFKLGPGNGSLTSAFYPDGSLKEAWMRRALRLQRELDRRGMVLDLIYFYQGQDEVLKDPAAIDRGVKNVTDWLIKNNCRNVIIEIANEFNVPEYGHNLYIFRHMDHLIKLARDQFGIMHAPFRLPISASSMSHPEIVYGPIRSDADLTIIHGNNLAPEGKRAWITSLFHDPQVPGPVYMDEDNNGRETTVENLRRELASCDAVFQSGGSWGYMPWVQVQNFPFRYYLPWASAQVSDDMPPAQRDPAYFHAVLDHMRTLVLHRRLLRNPATWLHDIDDANFTANVGSNCAYRYFPLVMDGMRRSHVCDVAELS